MKKITLLYICVMLVTMQLIVAQKMPDEGISSKHNKSIFLEAGVNLSLPVHIEMYRTHRLAIGINARAAKKISRKWEVGIRAEYDYRFTRRNLPEMSADPDILGEVLKRAAHRNFSLICIKPNVQYNSNSEWYWGAETGIGYAISDEGGKIGLGFVEEYDEHEQLGSCSGIYVGKYFTFHTKKKKLGLSMYLTNFLAEGHAENTLGLRFNYCFDK